MVHLSCDNVLETSDSDQSGLETNWTLEYLKSLRLRVRRVSTRKGVKITKDNL